MLAALRHEPSLLPLRSVVGFASWQDGQTNGQLCLHPMHLVCGQKRNVKTGRDDFYLTKEDVGSAQKHLALIAHLIHGGCAGIGF